MLRRKRKTIHFIRHAESDHNILPYDVRLKDPYLTLAGRAQAEALGRQLPVLDEIDLIVCSPMKRTISTALLAFRGQLRSTEQELIALPELQELSNKPCDTGSSLAELLTEFREDPVDFSYVPHDWDSKDRQWSPTEHRTLARMAKARAWLRDRREGNIVVIGHGHCMQLLLRDAPEEFTNDGIHQIQLGMLPVWRNCEWRSFVVEEDSTKVLLFEETRGSRKSKSKGKNVPGIDHAGHSRKASNTSICSYKSSKESSKSRWSLRSSRPNSTAPSSPAHSTRKSTTRLDNGTSSTESQKLFSAIGIQR